MSRFKRNDDWGFPRWRQYGAEQEPVQVKLCDHDGCGQPGDFKAPKSPHTDEKWLFCAEHVAEYNKNWDYFAGLSPEDAYARAQEEARATRGYEYARSWADGPDGDTERTTRAERSAFRALGIESDATPEQIKSAYRTLAKQYHPDRNLTEPEAVEKFHAVQRAYEILTSRVQGAKAK
jgi:DnaJ domain